MEVLSPGVILLQNALCFHLISIDESMTELNIILTTPLALPLRERILARLEIRGARRLPSAEEFLQGARWSQEGDASNKPLTDSQSLPTEMPRGRPGRPRSAVDEEAADRVDAGESRAIVYEWWLEAASQENPLRFDGIGSTPRELFKGLLKRRRARNKRDSVVQNQP
jgi:hypothetical protein